MKTEQLRQQLLGGAYGEQLSRLYCRPANETLPYAERFVKAVDGLEATFGPVEEGIRLFSAPGRTEIGGNHTDHQHGRVLAASVNLDVIAAAVPNGENIIRVQSEGFPMDVVDLSQLEPQPDEVNKSASLVRGIAARFAQMGCELHGFNAYTTSFVPKGSGLSSSAAFEVLVGVMVNSLLFDGKADPVQIAQIGQWAENNFFGKPCGLMDQMASSVGNIITIDFNDPAAPIVERVDFDFGGVGHALCILDSGADHADLTDEYAAVPGELAKVCSVFGKKVLREVDEAEFWARLPEVRAAAGDRGTLRAAHVYADNARVEKQVAALRGGDFASFLELVTDSGRSSWECLQNVIPAGYTTHQDVAVTIRLCQHLLDGAGAVRVHGGGFAGTVQAFVPLDKLEAFRAGAEAVLGEGKCHVLAIRPVGGAELTL